MIKLIALACFSLSFVSSTPVNVPTKERIMGGFIPSIREFPWMLSLQRSKKHYCGGCIISPFWSLTAAHCIVGETLSTLRLRAGSDAHGSGGELRPIAQALVHEDYNVATYDYDIALLKVDEHFEAGTWTIQVAPLPPPDYYPTRGALLNVTGWGFVLPGGDIIPGLMRGVTVPTVSREDCRRSYGADVITDRMLCAGYQEGGSDACKLDDGGPLVEGSTLVGIVSWRGVKCGEPGYPGIYTDVGALRGWIGQITGL